MVALFCLIIVHNYHFVMKAARFMTKRNQNRLSQQPMLYTLSFRSFLWMQSWKFMRIISKNGRTFAVGILQDDTKTKYSFKKGKET